MPNETFFNLNIEKQNKIMEAANNEFKRVALDKVRISNIIQEAGIPRGSFYQYFEDLNDLFVYFVNKFQDEREQTLIEIAKNIKGDLFDFILEQFAVDYKSFYFKKNHKLMMNIYKGFSLIPDLEEYYIKRRKKFVLNVLKEVNLKNIKYDNEDDLVKTFDLIQSLKKRVFMNSTWNNLTKEEALEEFKWFIDLIKNGILKEHKV
ncbi:TetR/AcrR family transcriptional regulator [Candidatus Izimaplasma bacterium ZiA1]|uniref:TetR family transcriptional regulator n=1 Tax=Candidatus Izimoplasma sp. ZiA1 TaxID=2024899 RepID=UPI00143BCB7C